MRVSDHPQKRKSPDEGLCVIHTAFFSEEQESESPLSNICFTRSVGGVL